MVMRVGGIVSGMDIEGMVSKLMAAERMPLERLQQEQKSLEWKRDSFRDINSHLLDLDKMMLDMKLTTTYKPKQVTSSMENAVTATASSSASNGNYSIDVKELATSAMNVGDKKDLTANEDMSDFKGEHTFQMYDENGKTQDYTFEIESGDKLSDVLKKISSSSDGNIRAFLDESKGRVVLESTRTGKYNPNSSEPEGDKVPEILFGESDFFTNGLGLDETKETGGTNAVFTYNNGLEIESKTNEYTINGLQLSFHNVTNGNARLSVNTDVDDSVDKIMNFIDKYNETIDKMNGSQLEERHRDFPPLTEEQREEMTEDQIKRWEEKAKSGLLRGEATIRDGMYTLRQSMQQTVSTDGAFNHISQVGITTTKNYLDGGRLEVNEEKLRAALRDNPDDVFKLFSNDDKGEARGLINRFDDALDRTRASIERKAGKSTATLDNYSIGKEIKHLNDRISIFETRMEKVEQRYWNQFTAMEKAISDLEQQSSQLFSQFGDM